MASKPKYILMKGWKTRLPSHCIIYMHVSSLQCTLSKYRSYTARRAGGVICRSASLTRLELGSSLTWMLYCDYGRGVPWTWGYVCCFLFGSSDWGLDVLCIPDVRCSHLGSASSFLFHFSCIRHHASLPPWLTDEFPTLEKLRISNKTKATTKKRDWPINPNSVPYPLSLHVLTTTSPKRPGPITIAHAAALQYREQAADAKEECSESEVWSSPDSHWGKGPCIGLPGSQTQLPLNTPGHTTQRPRLQTHTHT